MNWTGNSRLIESQGSLYLLFLVLVVLVAICMRIHGLDAESLWMDEIRQVSYYENSLFQIISNAARQQQPPLDYWIGHVVFKISNSDFAARLPAALFGAATVFSLVCLCQRICAWPFAIFAGLFMSLLPFHVYYSQETRPYSIALFFFLTFILILDSIARSGVLRLPQGIVLLIVTTLFLYSRALFPLCVFIVCFFYWLIPAINLWRHGGEQRRESYFKFHVLLILLAALLIYLPVFLHIISYGSAYLGRQAEGGLSTLLAGVKTIPLSPLWQSYSAQLEPVGGIMLFASCAAVVFPFLTGDAKRKDTLVFISALFIFVPLLNISIFSVSSPSEFRPSYAIYLMPLSIVLTACFSDFAWTKLPGNPGGLVVRSILVFVAMAILFCLSMASFESKSIRKKTDWRALSWYVVNNFTKKDLLLYDSLSNISNWKPAYPVGISRYPSGGVIQFAPVRGVTRGVEKAQGLDFRPTLILFHYREYKLTHNSKYPLMTIPEMVESIDMSGLKRSQLISSVEFTGLTVHTLNKNTGHFLNDSYKLFNEIAELIQESPMLLDIYMAMTSISAICDGPGEIYRENIQRIRRVSREKDQEMVSELLDSVKEHRQLLEPESLGTCHV